MTMRLFAHNGELCLITAAYQCGYDWTPETCLYDLVPYHGGEPYTGLRWHQFVALDDTTNVIPFPLNRVRLATGVSPSPPCVDTGRRQKVPFSPGSTGDGAAAPPAPFKSVGQAVADVVNRLNYVPDWV